MKHSFLFKIPGQPGMHPLDKIEQMHLPSYRRVEVVQIQHGKANQRIGFMSFAAVLSKFK